MQKNHTGKILAIGIVVLFIGVGIQPVFAIDNKTMSKYISYTKDIKHLSENEIKSIIIEFVDKIKNSNPEKISVKKFNNLLDKSNSIYIYLLFAFNFLILEIYFLKNNNLPMAKFCLIFFILSIVSYGYFSSPS